MTPAPAVLGSSAMGAGAAALAAAGAAALAAVGLGVALGLPAPVLYRFYAPRRALRVLGALGAAWNALLALGCCAFAVAVREPEFALLGLAPAGVAAFAVWLLRAPPEVSPPRGGSAQAGT